MEEDIPNIKSRQRFLNDLDRIEDKLHTIIDFYDELGILRQRRRHLVENLKEKDIIQTQRKITALKKQVTFHNNDFDIVGGKRLTKIESQTEKTKSIAQIYDLLGNLSSYHEDVNKRISDLQLLKKQNKSNADLRGLEVDNVLANLQKEKDDIDDKIIQFVIKNVVEGKDELFGIITNLEETNKEMEDIIILLDGRVEYLKETITGLMLENQLLKKGERSSDVVRKSVIGKSASLVLPMSLRMNRFGSDFSYENNSDYPSFMEPEQEDVQSVDKSTLDSFTLDAALATWRTDEASTQDQVKRIERDLEVMEVNQMKLNLLKHYVQRHGPKYINRNTLIDPTKGMSLWR